MKHLFFKLISLVLFLALLVSLFPAPATAAGGDGTATYRALLVPSKDSSLNEYPLLDAEHMKTALLQAENYSEANITTLELSYTSNNAKTTFLEAIAGTFRDADEDDVNLIYYSGHGDYNTSRQESSLTVSSSADLYASDLRTSILNSSLKGTFLFVLDACHTGGFVQKNVKSAEINSDTESVSEQNASQFLEGFSKGLTQSNNALSQTKGSGDFLGLANFKVLAAAGLQQYGVQLAIDDICGYFTTAITIGIGYAPANGAQPFGTAVNHHTYAADRNNDGVVTLSELYQWTKGYNNSSLTRCYPEDDDLVVVRYNKACYPGNVLQSAGIDTPVLGNSGTYQVTISYETTVSCTLSCQLPLNGENTPFQYLDPNHTLPTAYQFSRHSYTLIDSGGQILTLPAGTYDETTDTYRGCETISINTSGLSSIEYFLRLIPNVSGGTAELVPFQVIDNGNYAVITDNDDTISPDSFSTSVSTTTFAAIEDNTSELKLRLTFGATASANNSSFYSYGRSLISSGVYYSCVILDSAEKTVRTLADKTLCEYLWNADSSSSVTYKFDGFNDLYWGGKNDSGRYVRNGTYKLVVTAVYVKYSNSGEKTETVKQAEHTITVTTPLSAYSVTFLDGAQTVLEVPVFDGMPVSPIADYEKTNPGYRFDGWYTKDGTDGKWGELWDFSVSVQYDMRLYARWSPIITFHDGSDIVTFFYTSKGNTISSISNYDVSKPGAFFYGWYTKDGTDGDWGARWNFSRDTVQKPLNLYARWRLPEAYTKTAISEPELTTDASGKSVILLEVGCEENAEVMVAEYTDGRLTNIQMKTLSGSSETNQVLSFRMSVDKNSTYQVFMTKTEFSPLLTQALFSKE